MPKALIPALVEEEVAMGLEDSNLELEDGNLELEGLARTPSTERRKKEFWRFATNKSFYRSPRATQRAPACVLRTAFVTIV